MVSTQEIRKPRITRKEQKNRKFREYERSKKKEAKPDEGNHTKQEGDRTEGEKETKKRVR